MPESKGRKRGQNKPNRERRSGPPVTRGAAHARERSPEPGRRARIRPRTWRKIRRWVFIGGAGLVAFLVILSFALTSFRGAGTTSVTQGNTEPVAVTGSLVADSGTATHIEFRQGIAYDISPPNSGNHWPAWAQCGIYAVEINDEFVVHNMEHGQVIISYNLTDAEDLSRMDEIANDLPDLKRWGVVRPYSKIDEGTVSMTAWGVSDQVDGVDETRIKEFYEANRRNQNSPETTALGRAIACR